VTVEFACHTYYCQKRSVALHELPKNARAQRALV
jgi:hypothetical protein